MSLKYLSFIFIFGAAAITGCSLIDEDLSDCETPVEVSYELRLRTNFSSELAAELNNTTDLAAKNALIAYLGGIFTDTGHDLDLSFYNNGGDFARMVQKSQIMDASAASYTLFIQKRRYEHLAIANVERNEAVIAAGTDILTDARLDTGARDTVGTQKTGLFTARPKLDLYEKQEFLIPMYMANCASAIVIDTTDSHIKGMKVYMDGFAEKFDVRDSTYGFNPSKVFRTDLLEVNEGFQLCFASVHFPSKDTRTSKSIIEDPDSFESAESADVLWQFKAYTTVGDGKITRSVLEIKKPLRAGQLKVIKAKVGPDGVVRPHDPTVGVSITIDWNKGIEEDIEL